MLEELTPENCNDCYYHLLSELSFYYTISRHVRKVKRYLVRNLNSFYGLLGPAVQN